MSDDPNFYAWLDGELSPAESAEMERRVAADPALAALAEQHRALHKRLGHAFQAVVAVPVPKQLAAAAKPTAEIIDLAAQRERRRWSWGVQAAAMAASLAVGLVGGAALLSPDSSVRTSDGALVAGGKLEQALSTQLASAGGTGQTRIGLTFQTKNGSYCRSFSDAGSAGLACREGEAWRIRALFGSSGETSDYRMAAGEDVQLMELIDATMEGVPLGPAAEAEVVRRGWKGGGSGRT